MKLRPLSSYFPNRVIANTEIQNLCYNCKYNTKCEHRYKAVNNDPYSEVIGIDDGRVICKKREVVDNDGKDR